MNFKQLEIFVCVAELGSFARAAERLYMTPSALTQQINALERSLGCVLLERTSKGSALSEAGKKYLDYAVRMLKLQKEAVEACSAAGSGPRLVRIGTCGEDTSLLGLRDNMAMGSYTCRSICAKESRSIPGEAAVVIAAPTVEQMAAADITGYTPVVY